MEEYNVVSIQKASKMLEVSRTQIYRLMEAKILIEKIVGDKRMVDKTSIERYNILRKELNELKERMQQGA